jgi:hypothetical protein
MKMIACAWSVCILASSAVVAAEPNSAVSKADSYQYVFTDDPLNAGLFGGNDPIIRVRPGAGRGTLVRPRVSFVIEMLKSVEAL